MKAEQTKMVAYRLPRKTRRLIKRLAEKTQRSNTGVIIVAVERHGSEELKGEK